MDLCEGSGEQWNHILVLDAYVTLSHNSPQNTFTSTGNHIMFWSDLLECYSY